MVNDIDLGTLNSFFKLIDKLDLGESDLLQIYDYIQSNYDGDIDSILQKYNPPLNSKCPHCNSLKVKKNGNDYIRKNGIIIKKIPRCICHNCGKSFSARTNTIAFHAKLSLKDIRKIVECIKLGISCRAMKEELHYSINTIWLWKHKLADGNRIAHENDKFEGAIQCDETYLKLSYKGNHSKDGFRMYRWSRHRGYSIYFKQTRGLNKKHQVCICCALDSFRTVHASPLCLGAPSNKAFPKFFRDKYGSSAFLVTDGSAPLGVYASNYGIRIVQIVGGKSTVNGYNIQSVNAYHHNFKTSINPFRGISTKYLPNYLAIYNSLIYKKGSLREVRDEFIKVALCQNVTTKRKGMNKRNPIPLLNKPTYHRIVEYVPIWKAAGFNVF